MTSWNLDHGDLHHRRHTAAGGETAAGVPDLIPDRYPDGEEDGARGLFLRDGQRLRATQRPGDGSDAGDDLCGDAPGREALDSRSPPVDPAQSAVQRVKALTTERVRRPAIACTHARRVGQFRPHPCHANAVERPGRSAEGVGRQTERCKTVSAAMQRRRTRNWGDATGMPRDVVSRLRGTRGELAAKRRVRIGDRALRGGTGLATQRRKYFAQARPGPSVCSLRRSARTLARGHPGASVGSDIAAVAGVANVERGCLVSSSEMRNGAAPGSRRPGVSLGRRATGSRPRPHNWAMASCTLGVVLFNQAMELVHRDQHVSGEARGRFDEAYRRFAGLEICRQAGESV